MNKPYTTAREKLEFIRCATLGGRVVPNSQIRMMAETLDFALEVLTSGEDDETISNERLISALRSELERRIFPKMDIPGEVKDTALHLRDI